MNILHITTSDKGGAGIACIRLHRELLKNGIESNILALDKNTGGIENTEYINQGSGLSFFKRHIRPKFDRLKLSGRKNDYEGFSFLHSLFDLTSTAKYRNADLIHLHFTSEFIDLPSFLKKNKKPLLITLHDMNYFTGGCHVAFDCSGYTGNCYPCPQIEGAFCKYLAQKQLQKKIELFAKNDKKIITSPSRGLLDMSRASAVFSGSVHKHIPHGINPDEYNENDGNSFRQERGLKPDDFVILFVSDDLQRKNKGFHRLIDIFKLLQPDVKSRTKIIAVGRNQPDVTPELSNIIFFTGQINDPDLMKQLYFASDITAICSEWESFSLVALESLAAGKPVISYDINGPREIIRDGKNGFLIPFGDNEKYAEAITRLAVYRDVYQQFSSNCICRVKEKFDMAVVVSKYIDTYNRLLG